MLFSMLGDKDIVSVVQHLNQADLPITAWFIAEIDYPRAAPIEQLYGIVRTYTDGADIQTFSSLQRATHAAIADSQPQDLIVVCGSFHTIGEVLATLDVR